MNPLETSRSAENNYLSTNRAVKSIFRKMKVKHKIKILRYGDWETVPTLKTFNSTAVLNPEIHSFNKYSPGVL